MGYTIGGVFILTVVGWSLKKYINMLKWAENQAQCWAGELEHQREKEEKCSTN